MTKWTDEQIAAAVTKQMFELENHLVVGVPMVVQLLKNIRNDFATEHEFLQQQLNTMRSKYKFQEADELRKFQAYNR